MKPISLKKSDVVPFNSLSAKEFEHLCCDIFSRENPRWIFEPYGKTGQKQFGLDVIGFDIENSLVGIECKCWSKIEVNKFKNTIKRFYENINLWKDKKLIRFIICVACEIMDRSVIDIWIDESQKLISHGIHFEVWSARTIQNKLRAMPDIALRYITEEWWINCVLHFPKSNSSSIKNIKFSLEEKKLISSLYKMHFGTLLYSLDEIFNDTDRSILVNEIISLANDAKFHIADNGTSSLKLVSLLIQNSTILKSWELRRILGKISGEIIHPIANDSSMKRSIQDFLEICFSHPQSVILVALAATQNHSTALGVGVDNIKQLLNYPHPQVRWQLAKRWKNIEDIVVERIPFDMKIFVNDKWLRRRLLLTLLCDTFKIHDSKKIGIIAQCIDLEKDSLDGQYFINVLRGWLLSNTAFNPKDIGLPLSNPEIPIVSANIYTCIAKLETSNDLRDILSFCQSLEYQCMSLDTGSPLLPIDSYKSSEGRYGVIKKWVLSAISSISDEGLLTLLTEMLKCVDEGIRWSVSSLIPIWSNRISNSKERENLLCILVRDDHPWVLREAFDQIGDNLSILNGITPKLFVKECNMQMNNSIKMGWGREEVYPGFLKILSYYPNVVGNIILN